MANEQNNNLDNEGYQPDLVQEGYQPTPEEIPSHDFDPQGGHQPERDSSDQAPTPPEAD